MNVFHIGLGKTGSTSLQKNLLPLLKETGVIEKYNDEYMLEILAAYIHRHIEPEIVLKEVENLSSVFYSMETLIEWDPELWSIQCDRNLRAFGRDSIIIITIRSPSDYLRSLYQQKMQAGNILAPEHFFLSKNDYAKVEHIMRIGELDAINVDKFDLEYLCELYASKFDRVFVVASERLNDLEFLKAIYNIDEEALRKLQSAAKCGPRLNSSFSKRAVRLTLAREHLLNLVGFKTIGSNDLAMARILNLVTPATQFGKPLSSFTYQHRLWQFPIRILRSTFGYSGWRKVMMCGPKWLVGTIPYHLPKNIQESIFCSKNELFHSKIMNSRYGFTEWHNGTQIKRS